MSDHHEHASPAVAQVILDGLAPADRAKVDREAREKGVEPLEIVRLSLDVLIAKTAPKVG